MSSASKATTAGPGDADIGRPTMVSMTTTTDHDVIPVTEYHQPATDTPAAADATSQSVHALEERLERQAARRDGWTLLIFAFSAIALLAAIVAVGFGLRAIDETKGGVKAGGDGVAPATATVGLSEFKIEPAEVTIAAGGTPQVTNAGSAPHNLAVKGAELTTPDIGSGGSGTLGLAGLAPGDYTIYCHVPGHEQAGMKATLHVRPGAAGSAAGGQADHPATHAMSPEDMDATMARAVAAFPAKTEGVGAQALAPTVLADGTKRFDLVTKVVKWEVEPGKFVEAWTYNGTTPGPTLRVEPGDKVEVVVDNALPESTAVHFHGLVTPNAADGVPDITQAPIKPGQRFTYRFTAQSTPAVGMYHSHHNP